MEHEELNKFVSALIGGLIMDDLIVRVAYTQLRRKHNKLVEDHNKLREATSYLCHVINDNNIVLDDFDLIALQGQVERKEA
jgi:hypothetical protein